ncbi:HI0074 family nucleotidyltransferase substrate-binding subunit [Salirhabdus salicampi]|uniref:HI0074 family nucleotidyltransferase substrate-binding subunit n=1 Tax=Salirhabdus salicampi TaxID=476102 RepID=UPI0020C56349|nr:HI0074 family nucleotidyltransferase substrate-binding subunit [Salirhabdus salicampi]MCP8616276.1 HI0074 family nucleotidyltransferase substrate-binding subunit [Salirhabdus salicampi]
MDTASKEIRWKQLFDNFDKVLMILKKYNRTTLDRDIERAGYIHYFEMAMEHSKKVLHAYLEAKNIHVDTYREAVKEMTKLGVIEEQRPWFKAHNRRNLPMYIYHEKLSKELAQEVHDHYVPMLNELYEKLRANF